MENTFLRDAITKIQELAEQAQVKTMDIHDEQYSTKQLFKIEKPYYGPKCVELNTLDSLVEIIKTELEKAYKPLFVRICSPTKIDVFTSYKVDEQCRRDYIYQCTAELPNLVFDRYVEQEGFIIALRSKFVQNDDSDYVVNLLSKITDTNSVSSEDNGLSQTVQARKGISTALVENVTIRSRVELIPFRTFIEVDQPASQFLLRLKEGGGVGIFEADGGAWKLQAKTNINEYLSDKLADEIIDKKVVLIA